MFIFISGVIQIIIRNNVISFRSMDVMFKMNDFAIKKDLQCGLLSLDFTLNFTLNFLIMLYLFFLIFTLNSFNSF